MSARRDAWSIPAWLPQRYCGSLGIVMGLVLTSLVAVRAESMATFSDTELQRMAEMRLLFCFQGKGSCMPFDIGVLHECYSQIPAFRKQQVVVAGNSSGSIMAAYFGCFGFSSETLANAHRRVLRGDRQAVRNMENPRSKLAKLVRGRPTEISHFALREYIAFALGVEDWQTAGSLDEIIRRSRAVPRFPMLIVASNREVLDNRDPHSVLASRGYKRLNTDNMTVEWRPEVYDFYRAHPRKFAEDHPRLRLGRTPTIGHAVTFFVDPLTYRLLQRVPPEERQADLRLMTTAQDVGLAIIASVSEPTYFHEISESEPSKITTWGPAGDLGNSRQRIYYGGYLMPAPVQDVRRVLPGLRVIGTGFRPKPWITRKLLQDWLVADCELVAHLNEWWTDLEVLPDAEFQSHMAVRELTSPDEFRHGRRNAARALTGRDALPVFVRPPRYREPVAEAIWPCFEVPDLFDAGSAETPRHLKTLRGVDPLRAIPTTSQHEG